MVKIVIEILGYAIVFIFLWLTGGGKLLAVVLERVPFWLISGSLLLKIDNLFDLGFQIHIFQVHCQHRFKQVALHV